MRPRLRAGGPAGGEGPEAAGSWQLGEGAGAWALAVRPLTLSGVASRIAQRAWAEEAAEVTAGSLAVAAAARLKPKWTVIPELLASHFAGIPGSSGEEEVLCENRAPHPGANGRIARRSTSGRARAGRGAAPGPACVRRRRPWR